MFYFYILYFLIIAPFLPSRHSQCFYCDNHWMAQCKVQFRGYYSEEDVRIVEPPGDPTIDLWDKCSPLGSKIEYVKEYCCVYSPEIGCTVALSPKVYTENPGNYCAKCFGICHCDTASMLQPWHWCGLCIVLMALILIISGIKNI